MRSSRSVSLALIQAKSVSSHGDAVTIVNVHFSYILSVLNSSMLTRLAYRAWRQVLDCKGEDVSSILTLRKRQQWRKDEEQQCREELHIENRMRRRRTPRTVFQSTVLRQGAFQEEAVQSTSDAKEEGGARKHDKRKQFACEHGPFIIPYGPGYVINRGAECYYPRQSVAQHCQNS